ncbi:hypothetical protein VE04_00156 [Pseudogymnoascus sp. 24MN13]|nr:hypothetical protein VE04_00156 [Pseudogymnoascus sp. 24MN13]
MHTSTLLAFGLLALAPLINGQDVASGGLARRHIGGGAVIARGVAIDLEARHHKGKKGKKVQDIQDRSPEPHHKGKKVQDIQDRSPEPHHKGKKVQAAARHEHELEDRSPEPHHKGNKAAAGNGAAAQDATAATTATNANVACARDVQDIEARHHQGNKARRCRTCHRGREPGVLKR